MLPLYLTMLISLAVLVLAYRFAYTAPNAPMWLTRIPAPKYGSFFIYAGMFSVSGLLVYALFMQIMLIPSPSMEPSLNTGDKILIKPAAFGLINPLTGSHMTEGNFDSLKRGDVVIGKFAYNADVRYIKRVIGLPGDTISISKTELDINGNTYPFEPTDMPDIFVIEIESKRFKIKISPDGKFQPQQNVTIPRNHVFLLGDNLNKSSDSREIGFIPLKNLIGKPF